MRNLLFFLNILLFDFFFFQAEDGIRDVAVTGVQTCALPISIAKKNNLITTMGGNLSTKSSDLIQKLYERGLLDRVETRNVVIELNAANVDNLSNTIKLVLDFELSWLQNKKDKYNDIVEDCVYRSELLRNRQ